MEIDTIFKIAGIGILVAVIGQVLTKSGREEMAMVTTLAGLVIVLMMVVDMIAEFFQNVRSVFQLF
ncbi:MAG: stage III sporulation protein AC [Eubacteriales bacterium]|nr:stage III sporulation protein AC [Eubacteriales bacterium]